MAISLQDLSSVRVPVTINDGATNGGVFSLTSPAAGSLSNIFPPIQQNERDAGITRYRKVLVENANADNDKLFNGKVRFLNVPPGDEWVTFFAGTFDDTQGTFNSANQYGTGILGNTANNGDTVIQVQLEDASMNVFKVGYTVQIGNESFELTAVSNAGTLFDLTLSGQIALGPYDGVLDAGGSVYVASVMPYAPSVGASYESFVVGSGAGTYDDTLFPVIGDNIGGVDDNFTLTFTSATEFDAVGAASGPIGSGVITADFTPVNAAGSGRPFFTLDFDGFGGTFSAGDTITFTTRPSGVPIWICQTVPAGANTISESCFNIELSGDFV